MRIKKLSSKKNRKNLGLLALLILVAAAVYFGVSGEPKEEAPLAEKPRGCVDLPSSGKRTYSVTRDRPKNFEIVEVQVDPIDVKKGEIQIITVKVKDASNNTIARRGGIQAKIYTDNKNTAAVAFALKSTEQSKDGSSTFTIWEGLWTKDDYSCHTYMETITATNDKGDNDKVDLSFR